MKNLTTPLCVLAALLIACTAARAESPAEPQPDARIDAAVALLEEMQFKDQLALMRESMKPVMQQQMANLGDQLDAELTAEHQAVIDRYMAQMTDLSFSEEMIEQMTLDAAAVYANVFTLEEIEAIADFYRSPAGASMLAKMPQISQQLMQLTLKSQQTVMADIAELSRQMTEELKAISEGENN